MHFLTQKNGSGALDSNSRSIASFEATVLQKKTNSYEKPFCSQKYRDFLVMTYTLKHRAALNPEQKIDLLMTLHKVNQNQPDLLQYSSKKHAFGPSDLRTFGQQHELNWGMKKNQSLPLTTY